MKKKPIISTKQIASLAALQCTHAEAAAVLGIRVTRFRYLLSSDERVRKAWETGKNRGKLSLRRTQRRLARTSAPMAIFLGKQYLGQREVVTNELTGPEGQSIFDAEKLSASERDELRSLITRGSRQESSPE